jgi:hypothetical protein
MDNVQKHKNSNNAKSLLCCLRPLPASTAYNRHSTTDFLKVKFNDHATEYRHSLLWSPWLSCIVWCGISSSSIQRRFKAL